MALFSFASCIATQQNATFWGLCTQAGVMTPKFELPTRFLNDAPTQQVSSSCVYSFGSYCVDKHTHKQTNPHTNKQILAKTSKVLRYATTLGNHRLAAHRPRKTTSDQAPTSSSTDNISETTSLSRQSIALVLTAKLTAISRKYTKNQPQ